MSDNPIPREIIEFNEKQSAGELPICVRLAELIATALPDAESRIWHAHPVWFLDGNPVVGYSKLKAGIRLMFWSGANFDEPELQTGTGKFKDASKLYQSHDEIDPVPISRWLEKSRDIQWDYQNIRKTRGLLRRR